MHALNRSLIPLLCLLATSLARGAEDKWVTYENCQLLPNASNDGDSFHVRASGREYIRRWREIRGTVLVLDGVSGRVLDLLSNPAFDAFCRRNKK